MWKIHFLYFLFLLSGYCLVIKDSAHQGMLFDSSVCPEECLSGDSLWLKHALFNWEKFNIYPFSITNLEAGNLPDQRASKQNSEKVDNLHVQNAVYVGRNVKEFSELKYERVLRIKMKPTDKVQSCPTNMFFFWKKNQTSELGISAYWKCMSNYINIILARLNHTLNSTGDRLARSQCCTCWMSLKEYYFFFYIYYL